MGKHVLVVVVLSAVGSMGGVRTLGGQSAVLVSFELEDQFKRVHRHSDFANRVLVMIGSDRKGSTFHDRWEDALRDSLATELDAGQLAFVSVANLRGVPFFVRTSVRGKFSQNEEEWILLDWKGTLAEAYHFEAEATNIAIFKPSGALVGRVHATELDAELLASVVDVVRGLAHGTP